MPILVGKSRGRNLATCGVDCVEQCYVFCMERLGKHAADRERSGSGTNGTNGAVPAVVVNALNVVRGGTTILHDVSLTVARGSIIGLLGPSGCGKTTLMRSIVGVQRIAAGSIRVLGLETGARELRGRIGYVTQDVSVYADLTVKQNVEYFATLYGVGRDAVEQAMATVGLADYAGRRVSRLSGGQASRASLACALVGNPEVLVLDEPTVGLDPLTRTDLWDTFRALARAGHTLVVSSHVMDEATRCDSLLLMREGEVLGHLTPAQLMQRTGADSPDEAFLVLIKSHEAGDELGKRLRDGLDQRLRGGLDQRRRSRHRQADAPSQDRHGDDDALDSSTERNDQREGQS